VTQKEGKSGERVKNPPPSIKKPTLKWKKNHREEGSSEKIKGNRLGSRDSPKTTMGKEIYGEGVRTGPFIRFDRKMVRNERFTVFAAREGDGEKVGLWSLERQLGGNPRALSPKKENLEGRGKLSFRAGKLRKRCHGVSVRSNW